MTPAHPKASGRASKDKDRGKPKSDVVAPVAETPAPGPTFVVEASLASIVVPKLHTWLDDLADAIPRVIHQRDGEAVHDLRVSLRRIRSLLRVVRPVFGRFHVGRIRAEMQRTAAATGALRDEEVLEETLDALDLSAPHRKALAPWLRTRADRETELRAEVIRLLTSGALEAPRAELRALLTLPLRPGRDKEAPRFARRGVLEAQKQVEALRTADVADVQGMHDLRIACKRLRYAVEALGPVLPPELRAWGHVAATFQKVLGHLHDHDVALETVRDASELSEATRAVVTEALSKKRAHHADHYLAEVGFAVVGGEVAAPAEETTEAPPVKPPRRRAPRKSPTSKA
jgi:CHAD domain-containing protein